MSNTKSSTLVLCSHCGEEVRAPFLDASGNNFCCQGCLSVFSILEKGNLQQFYEIQKQTGEFTGPAIVEEESSFHYMDQMSFTEEYARLLNQSWTMSFYLKGVHCLACLWLIEKLPELCPSVKEARLNLGKSLVTLSLKEGETSFREAAETLNQLGYAPYPLSDKDDLQKLQAKEERSLLLKIGIAGFSMMNIMLYTGSVYAGADGAYFIGFGLLSFLLAIPVVGYSATPFYQSARAALKNQRVNIDIPLSLAIILGFLMSTYFLLKGGEHYYYDSIATLTFLILLSRFFLRKVQQTSLNQNDLLGIFQRGTALRRNKEGEFEQVLPQDIVVGDIIKVAPNRVLPADGMIIEGSTRLNLSTLTGESQNIHHAKDAEVFMGTLNVEKNILIKVTKIGEETRIGQLLNKISSEKKEKSHFNYLTDTVSKYFVQVVLLLGFSSLFIAPFFFGLEKALENALAFIIVTCPCALGLATPLTFSRIMALGQKRGIIIKTEEVLERLSQTQNVIFDKTGTLTMGNYVVKSAHITQSDAFSHYSPEELTFALEGRSQHPVARSLVSWAKRKGTYLSPLSFDSWEEVVGVGIRAKEGSNSFEVFSIHAEEEKSKDAHIVVTKNNEEILRFILKDQIKKESPTLIGQLKKNRFQLHLYSGDKKVIVEDVARELGIPKENVGSEMSPEDKAARVKELSHSLFVGDGANDSLAFREASTSIATHGSVEMSLRVADIFLAKPDITKVLELITLSKRAVKVVKTNLTFSLSYNILGAALALTGFIGPLEAAVLMPISSLTVLGITVLGTRDSQVKEEQNGNS